MAKGTRRTTPIWLLGIASLAACTSDTVHPAEAAGVATADSPPPAAVSQRIAVSGSAVLFAASTVIHGEEATATGMIQQFSQVGQLTGDLSGTLLFQPTAVYDFESGTLVNTGTQFFSGTVAGSDPVILHDDRFRFDIDLSTGTTTGTAHLSRSNDAPLKGGWFECDLVIAGTGMTADGDITSDYVGECLRRGNPK